MSVNLIIGIVIIIFGGILTVIAVKILLEKQRTQEWTEIQATIENSTSKKKTEDQGSNYIETEILSA